MTSEEYETFKDSNTLEDVLGTLLLLPEEEVWWYVRDMIENNKEIFT